MMTNTGARLARYQPAEEQQDEPRLGSETERTNRTLPVAAQPLIPVIPVQPIVRPVGQETVAKAVPPPIPNEEVEMLAREFASMNLNQVAVATVMKDMPRYGNIFGNALKFNAFCAVV